MCWFWQPSQKCQVSSVVFIAHDRFVLKYSLGETYQTRSFNRPLERMTTYIYNTVKRT